MSSPIGGFMPIPLAMMMPFMAAQSMLMGDAFGKGFQFGKRKISALSNEEFNKLDMSAMVSNMQTEFRNLVPTLQQSIVDSRQVQNVIIDEMIKIVPEFLKFMTTTAITTATTGIQQTGEQIAHALGTHWGHDAPTTTTPTTTSTTTTPTTTSTTTSTPTSTTEKVTLTVWASYKQYTNAGKYPTAAEVQKTLEGIIRGQFIIYSVTRNGSVQKNKVPGGNNNTALYTVIAQKIEGLTSQTFYIIIR